MTHPHHSFKFVCHHYISGNEVHQCDCGERIFVVPRVMGFPLKVDPTLPLGTVQMMRQWGLRWCGKLTERLSGIDYLPPRNRVMSKDPFYPVGDPIQRYHLTHELYMLSEMRFHGKVAWHRADMLGTWLRREDYLIKLLGLEPRPPEPQKGGDAEC